MKTNDDLKKENPDLYKVAREQGTEAPFTGEYLSTKESGMYHCAVCDSQLFSSEAKFDSGTGWPSFSDPVAQKSVELKEDVSHGMTRTEVVCKKCNSHLGHVFQDGPKTDSGTCNRFCINSVSLNLKKEDE